MRDRFDMLNRANTVNALTGALGAAGAVIGAMIDAPAYVVLGPALAAGVALAHSFHLRDKRAWMITSGVLRAQIDARDRLLRAHEEHLESEQEH